MYLRNSSLFFWNYGSCSSFNCAWACKTKVLFESNICCSFAEDFCLVFLTAPFYVKHVPLYFMNFCTYFKFLFFGTKTIIPQKKAVQIFDLMDGVSDLIFTGSWMLRFYILIRFWYLNASWNISKSNFMKNHLFWILYQIIFCGNNFWFTVNILTKSFF